jgi:DNA repair exonuclease SbcCD ATPase subunit
MAAYERPTELLDSEAAWRALVQDRLRSLTRWLVAIGVLSAVSLGIGLWALLAAQDDDGRRRAAGVRALEDRVDELESEVERAPSRVVVSVRDEQQALEERIDVLEEGTNDAVEEVRRDVEEVRRDVEKLQARVDELEQQQQRPTPPGQ